METCCLAVSMTLQNMKSPFVCKYVCMHSFMYCVHMWVMSAACISGSCVSTFGLAVVCVCVRVCVHIGIECITTDHFFLQCSVPIIGTLQFALAMYG